MQSIKDPFSQSVSWLLRAENILILTHKKIDGDALSSTIALYSVLKKMGKNVTAVCEDPVPEVFQFLPMHEAVGQSLSATQDVVFSIGCKGAEIDSIRYTIENEKINIFITPKKGDITNKDVSFNKRYQSYDLVVVLDSPDLESLGPVYDNNIDMFFHVPLLNIDHKVHNTYFGKINLVDITASSTAEILMQLFQHFPQKDLFDEDLATLLLTGIIVDTGSFQNPNTTPKAFASASKLIGLGARQQEIIKNIYKTKKLETLKLWGKILGNVKNDPLFRMLWSSVSVRDGRDTKHLQNDMLQLMENLMVNAPGAEIITLFFEDPAKRVHVFLKVLNPSIDPFSLLNLVGGTVNVDEFTAVVSESLSDSEARVVTLFREYQSNRLGISPQMSSVQSGSSVPVVQQPLHPDAPLISEQEVEEKLEKSLLDQLASS